MAYDESTFNLLGLPVELQVRICRLVYDSTPWDLIIRCVETQGPITSDIKIPEPIVAMQRFPPLPSALARTCRHISDLTRQLRHTSYAGYTGRLLVEDGYEFEIYFDDNWFWDRISPYIESNIPNQLRECTRIVAYPCTFFDQQHGCWDRLPLFTRKNFGGVGAMEISSRMLQYMTEDGGWQQIPLNTVNERAVEEMKKTVIGICDSNPGFEEALKMYDVQLGLSCTVHTQDRTYSGGFVEGETEVEWVKGIYAFGGFDNQGQLVASIEDVDSWVIRYADDCPDPPKIGYSRYQKEIYGY